MNRLEVGIQTSYGHITVALETTKVPHTVDNFLQYVSDGFYDGTLVHRVIDNFIIQGGGYEPGLIQKPTRPPIINESASGLSNRRGTIAMARLPDEPNSATSQFFINSSDNDMLDFDPADADKSGYCAFGQVTEGMEIVEHIEGVATYSVDEHHDVPLAEITILKMELLNKK